VRFFLYHTRLLESKVLTLARYFKVVLVLGARQVGKSTLLQHLFPDYKRFVFDPVQDPLQIRNDPDLFLKSVPAPMILDEVQYVPELLSAIKRWVDEHPESGQFILTGSQNFSVIKSISESLAGRVGILELSPMTTTEQYALHASSWIYSWLAQDFKAIEKGSLISDLTIHQVIWRGGYPGTLDLPDSVIANYFDSYMQTYIERDVRNLSHIENMQLFYNFVRLQAALTAQEVNHSQRGRELGIAMTTAQKWATNLISTYLWYEVSAYSTNALKRISKKPKGFLNDTGLACHLMRISSSQSLLGHPQLGALFETFCVNEIKNIISTFDTKPWLYHWRSNGGAEVDLILEIDNKLFPIEFKCKTSLSKRDAQGIQAFFKTYADHKQIAPGLIIYAGDYFIKLSENVYGLPWNWLAELSPSPASAFNSA